MAIVFAFAGIGIFFTGFTLAVWLCTPNCVKQRAGPYDWSQEADF